MHDKKDAGPKAHDETPRSEADKDPEKERDGEDASLAPINPTPADGGKVRGDGDPPVGSVR